MLMEAVKRAQLAELETIQALTNFWVNESTVFVRYIIPEDYLIPMTPADQDYILELNDRDEGVKVVMSGHSIYVVGKMPEARIRTRAVALAVEERLREVFGRFKKIRSDDYTYAIQGSHLSLNA